MGADAGGPLICTGCGVEEGAFLKAGESTWCPSCLKKHVAELEIEVERLTEALARIAHAHDEHGPLIMSYEGEARASASKALDWAQRIAKKTLDPEYEDE